MLGITGDLGQRHLVGAPAALGQLAVDLLRPGPTLGGAQHDHRPAWPFDILTLAIACAALDRGDAVKDGVEVLSHDAVHDVRLVAFDYKWLVTVAFEQASQLMGR